MAEKPSMVDKVPTQLDEEELKAEMNVEIPQGMDMNEIPDNIEIMEEDDGSVVIDFDPREDKSMDGDFYANLAEDMSDDELGRLSGELSGEFEENKNSRQEWEDAFANGLELLGFSYEERAQPFRGASGVTHPLLAESATQFQAQAFNELLPPGGPVRTLVMGTSTPEKEDQAQRVKEFMNYYITSVRRNIRLNLTKCYFICPLQGQHLKKFTMMKTWIELSASLYQLKI